MEQQSPAVPWTPKIHLQLPLVSGQGAYYLQLSAVELLFSSAVDPQLCREMLGEPPGALATTWSRELRFPSGIPPRSPLQQRPCSQVQRRFCGRSVDGGGRKTKIQPQEEDVAQTKSTCPTQGLKKYFKQI
uniref:Uncharacterized protein n=1 Tax=Molossus molossus TaxID=27622 RepID=A0A7J8E3E9_MOLMO|nr:hypothetical protein HJG59_009085 [Molossus molossus]